jgi:hypothetical protein
VTDITKIEGHLKTVEGNRETITWILEQQGQLRTELLAFYKKDIKEIDAALQSIGLGEDGPKFHQKLLEEVRTAFMSQWQRSYDLVCPAGALGQTENTAG